MRDPWTLTSITAARIAGHCTADILRNRRELATWYELETHGGPTMGGELSRLAIRVAELKRELYRDLARNPALVLLPPAAWSMTMEVIRRG